MPNGTSFGAGLDTSAGPRGFAAEVTQGEQGASAFLKVPSEASRDFVYGVQPASRQLAAFSPIEALAPELRFEARTFFSDGSKGYDLMGMTQDQIAADVLVQFERYLQLFQLPATALLVTAPEHGPETAPRA